MLDLGTILGNARKRYGYSQNEVAKALGISQANIVKYERNKVAKPNRTVLEKLAALYHLDTEKLMAYAYPEKNNKVPKQIYEMLEKPEALPFLTKAYNEYVEYVNGLEKLNNASN